MKFSLAHKYHLPAIMDIIHDAQAYLASLGIDQWQNGYPDEHKILTDILNNESYIVTNKEAQIMATAMFTTRPDPTYTVIDGRWLTHDYAKYGVIHRMAVNNNFRKHGLAKFIFSQCEQMLKDSHTASMRIDTHEENQGMQRLLQKLGYVHCGIIYTDDGSKRLAFEKLMG